MRELILRDATIRVWLPDPLLFCPTEGGRGWLCVEEEVGDEMLLFATNCQLHALNEALGRRKGKRLYRIQSTSRHLPQMGESAFIREWNVRLINKKPLQES